MIQTAGASHSFACPPVNAFSDLSVKNGALACKKHQYSHLQCFLVNLCLFLKLVLHCNWQPWVISP